LKYFNKVNAERFSRMKLSRLQEIPDSLPQFPSVSFSNQDVEEWCSKERITGLKTWNGKLDINLPRQPWLKNFSKPKR
jgi:hypothetical protein